jgi:hypothetical protein
MIKRYNQFINDKTNEEFVFSKEQETTKPATPVVEPGVRPAVEPRPAPPALIPDEGNSPLESPAKAEMEEEAGDMYAQKLQELADHLGTEVKDNKIDYMGHIITFPSETEKYHIEGVKKAFNTAEEVVAELEKHKDVQTDIDEDEYEKGDLAFESKSYRHTRGNKLRRK